MSETTPYEAKRSDEPRRDEPAGLDVEIRDEVPFHIPRD